ncbi:MAG: OmpH family outer membrane protein, partial [Firmicutes bacterium]|nr:OmpH family outer membrane protein [Bacillota bacterium]
MKSSKGFLKGKQVLGLIILLVVLALSISFYFFGRNYMVKMGWIYTPVGSISKASIDSTEEFKKAYENLARLDQELRQKLEKEGAGKSREEQGRLLLKYKQEYDMTRNKTLNPLNARVEAAIARVAKSKKMTVILDKNIVVCGVPDQAPEVIKVFQNEKNITPPDVVTFPGSPIGYFDQTVVLQLEVFTKAKNKIQKMRDDMLKELDAKIRTLKTEKDRQKLAQQYAMAFEEEKNKTLEPLMNGVKKSVEEVAKQENLSLVLIFASSS